MIVSRSFETELSKCYHNQQIITLINNQILELHYLPEVKCLSKFTIIKFKVPAITQTYKFTTDSHEIEFFIVLGWGFPLHSPRVHLKDQIMLPGINDCRNLVLNIIEQEQWSYKISLKKIQLGIPQFLEKLAGKDNIFDIGRFGSFQLNTVYSMDVIRELRDDNLFFALEFKEENEFKMVVIDISSTHFTIFTTKEQPHYQNGGFKIPQENEITNCMLLFYAELGSISDIFIDRSSFSDIHITFSAKKSENINEKQVSVIKRFKVKKGLNFIHKVLKGIKNFDPVQTKLNFNMENINEEEKFILKEIKKSEETFKNQMNISTVKQLADRYQAAVEFYSSQNIPYYEVYLDDITKLYKEEEVKLIMGTLEIPDERTV